MFSSQRLQRLIQQSEQAEQPPPPTPPPQPIASSPSSSSPQTVQANESDLSQRGNGHSQRGGGRGGRGGRGGQRGGGQRGGRGSSGSSEAVGGEMDENKQQPLDELHSPTQRGGRGRNKKNGSQRPPSAANVQANGEADPNNPSPAAAAPSGPSKKELALAAAKARAEAKAKAEAYLDDPTNPINIPAPALVTELTQIARRYNKSFKQTQQRSTIICSVSFSPTDPDFPFLLPPDKIIVQFVFNDISLYPYAPLPQPTPANEKLIERLKGRVAVNILNEDRDIPRYLREAIRTSLLFYIHSTQYGHPQILRNTFKMLDKEISGWMVLAKQKQDALVARTVAKLTGQTPATTTATTATTTATSNTSTATSPSAPIVAATPSLSSSSPTVSLTPTPSPPASSSSPPATQTIRSEPGDFDAIEPEDVWTDAQQAALEAGLKNIPRTLPTQERWDKIAAGVEGKTKKQVLARYKSIRDAVKNSTLDTVKTASTTSVSSSPPPSASSSSTTVSLAHLTNAQEVDMDESARIHADRIRMQQIEREMEALRLMEQKAEEEAERIANKGKKQKKKPKKEDESSEDDSDDGESGDEMKEPVTERISLNPQHRGTQILVDDLEMSGLGILKSSLFRVQLLCIRCESRVDIEFAPSNGISNPASERCARCGIQLSIVYRPEMVHEHSDSFGYLDLINGELFDLLPSDFFGTCLECFTEHPIKNLARAQTYESNCRSCHVKLSCKIGGFEFDRITQAKMDYDDTGPSDSRGRKAAAAVDPREVLAARNRSKEQALLKVGTALPNKGACKHYKHSYRWMRFPCCGKAYPCDDCHNEQETDHKGVWATRMICGACSKEQAFSSKPCTNWSEAALKHSVDSIELLALISPLFFSVVAPIVSGLAFSTVAKTFWEGGAGMRDRVRLSRNDSKKHHGLMKTKSMKETRVGKKGKDTNKTGKKETGNNTG